MDTLYVSQFKSVIAIDTLNYDTAMYTQAENVLLAVLIAFIIGLGVGYLIDIITN